MEILAQPSLSEADTESLAASLRRVLPAGVSLFVVALNDRGIGTKRRVVAREF
jgi:hypothetical protein